MYIEMEMISAIKIYIKKGGRANLDSLNSGYDGMNIIINTV